MARQPLITVSMAFALAACGEDPGYEGAFDMPVAAAVLQPEVGGPFQQPVGFVANGVGGQIIPLDLKFGRFLTDDPTAGFLRTQWLPTGGARVLADVAVYAPTASEVTLYAADRAFSTLLRVPYVVGLDDNGFPIEGFLQDGEIVTEPLILDVRAEVSGNVRLENIEVKAGYTTTETWVVEFVPEGGHWLVTGSRSGRQEQRVASGQRFVAEKRRIAFTIQGQGLEGDRFEIDTDNGVRELDIGGTPQVLAMSPDQTVLAMVIADEDGDASLRLMDPATETLTDIDLPDDAEPGRLAWSDDGMALFAADNGRPAFWEIRGPGTVIEHVLPFPTVDVAPLFSMELGRRVFLVPLDGDTVWIYDLDEEDFVDINPAVPGAQGMPFASPVTGIEAIPLEHLYRDVNDDGVRRSGRSVAVSLQQGKVVFMEEETGCLLRDQLGPRTQIDGSLGQIRDVATNFDNVPFGAFMQENLGNDRRVIVNPCAGIAQEEAWTVRFNRNLAAWVVEGGLSGTQERLAFEDERYLSDNGEVSFVIRAGSAPSQDGWLFTFSVLDGVLEANGDNDRDGQREIPMDVPGDPVFFHYTVGPARAGWQRVDRRAFVLVPAQSADLVGRVDPQEGDIEVRWD